MGWLAGCGSSLNSLGVFLDPLRDARLIVQELETIYVTRGKKACGSPPRVRALEDVIDPE